MSFTFTGLVNSCVWIFAGASHVFDVSEQVSFGVLHSQVAEVNTNQKKGNRGPAFGPTFNR